ncbi:carbohydrate ABC transporter permease [Spelaeicoccus albus]
MTMTSHDRTTALPQRRSGSRRRQRILMTVLLTILAVAVSVLFVLPAVWMLFGSLAPGNSVISNVSPLSWHTLIPRKWTLSNYRELFGALGFLRPMFNSLFVTFASVAIGLALSAPAAYALAVVRFRGREVIFSLLVIGFMIPFEAIAIPLAHVFTDWNLDNTYVALILPGIGNGLAIFNMRQSFLGVPASLREAAVIDGASDFRILSRIYIPLNGTTMINSGLLIFMGQWTAYLWPLLIVSSDSKQIAAVALARTYTSSLFDFGQLFAAALVISIVPAVVLFVLQRHFSISIATSGER